MVKVCNYGFDSSFKNEHEDLYHISLTQNILSGRYKNWIIWFLKDGSKRHAEIKRFLQNLSQGSLTKQLRELENDQIIERNVYAEVPPKVEYKLTNMGVELVKVIKTMEEFGKKYSD